MIPRSEKAGNHVLMLVVWKLDRELQFRLRFAKRIANIITRRRLRMANRTDLRARAFEKLRPMTIHAGRVVGIVDDIGKLRPVLPRNDVTGLALRLVLLCGVGKVGVVDNAD